jgi:hypothetical protein
LDPIGIMGALGEEHEQNELAVTTPQKERSLWESGLQKFLQVQ